VVAIVAIAFSGPILILLVTVVVVPAGCFYYHRKTRKSVHKVVAPFQRLEYMLMMSLITRCACGQFKSHAIVAMTTYTTEGQHFPTQSISSQVAQPHSQAPPHRFVASCTRDKTNLFIVTKAGKGLGS